MLDSADLMKKLNPNWKEPVGSGVILCFKQESPKHVDQLYDKVTGAGFLEYKANILVRAKGYNPVERTIPLPAGSQRVVVIMTRGKDVYYKPRPGDESQKLRREAERLRD